MSKKNIDLTIKGESFKGKQQLENLTNLTSSTDFFKKSGKNFNPLSKAEYYGTLIQIMRSDIVELQSMIKKHSDVLMLYKMNSKK